MRVTKSKSAAMLLLAPAAALGVSSFVGMTAASAASAESSSYEAKLEPLNDSTASGAVTLTLDGDKATVTQKVTGLAESFMDKPYPHVQHIHIDAQGTCPEASADKDGDEVVSTTEGDPFYGAVGTTLSLSGDTSPKAATTLTVAPSGADFDYKRTFALNPATMKSLKAGKAVVVVHGLDPSTLSTKAQAAKSDLVPALPLAATSPALCGALVAAEANEASVAAGSGEAAASAEPSEASASAQPSEGFDEAQASGATTGSETGESATGAGTDESGVESETGESATGSETGESTTGESTTGESGVGSETDESTDEAQVDEVPAGGADTGDGTPAGANQALLLTSGGLLLAAGGVLGARRRAARQS